MIFTFDFNLSAWIQDLKIEAENYDEAMEKLRTMSAYDIVDEGYVKNTDITDLDYTTDEEEEL